MKIDLDRSKKVPAVTLVIPVFNEEQNINLFIEYVDGIFSKNNIPDYTYLFVNDGSSDDTMAVLIENREKNSHVNIVDLSRNFGKEAALTAGLRYAKGDVMVPIDVDLQDPPELISEMIEKWRDGYDVVVAKRFDRMSDTYAKRMTAKLFYRVHNLISTNKIPEDVGDFRLMDRRVVDEINRLPETQRFMKGLLSWIGFETATLSYTRASRASGKTKFGIWKLWNLALEGFTSFGTAPLKIWIYIGAGIATMSIIYSIIMLLRVFFMGADVPGFASLIVSITFLGGLQLIGIGMLGEYVGRTYIESKNRPVFVIKKIYD